MDVDGLDGGEIEEDALHIDADGELSSEDVSDAEFEEGFHDDRTGEHLISRAGYEGEVGRGRVHGEDRAPQGGGHRGVPRDDWEAIDQHPMGGCEQGVNGVAGCPMQARGTGFQAQGREGPVGHFRRNASERRSAERETVPAEDHVD